MEWAFVYKRQVGSGGRHRAATPYINQSVTDIIEAVSTAISDPTLAQSIYFSPTALTHIRRLIETGGSIIVDTTLLAGDIDARLLGTNGAKVLCFIDDEQVVSLAQLRRVTRAEVAVDTGLAVPGPKLMVVGSAPAAIARMIHRRQSEPMSDVCVLAAPTGFANVIQMKERLIDSDLNSIVVRGKKGGVPMTVALINAILREIAQHPSN